MRKQSHHTIAKAADNDYWQNQFRNEDDNEAGRETKDDAPACRIAVEGDEPIKRMGHGTRPGWEPAKAAARTAWDLSADAPPPDADHDRL